MHFQANMRNNGRNSIFKDKETRNKVLVIFLYVKVLSQSEQLCVWTVSTIEQGTVYVSSVQEPQNKQWKTSILVRKKKAKHEW